MNPEEKLPPIKKFKREDLDELISKMKGKGKRRKVREEVDEDGSHEEKELVNRYSEVSKIERIKEKYRNYMKREEELYEVLEKQKNF